MKHLKLFFALFAMLALGVGNAWAEEVTYVFTSKDWAAKIGSTPANWTSNKAGAGFSNNGIQVTTAATGANGTSPISYNNISQIVVTYNTNTSKGKGTLSVKIGDNAVTTNNWQYSGNANGTSANFTSTFDYSSPQSGKVTLTANTTTNSIYVVSIKIITSAGSEPPTPAKTYDVTWMVNGEEWDTTEDVEENTQITTLPTEPTDECAGKVFQGWTDKEITDGQKPAVLFKDKSPKITDGLTTFYAVFATETNSGSGNLTTTFTPNVDDLSTGKNGITIKMSNTAGASGYYQIFKSSSMTITSENAITSFTITCTARDKSKYGPGNITFTEGTYSYSGTTGTWTGNATSLTSGNAAEQLRIKSIVVTTSGGSTISDYTTSCDGSTETVVLLIPKNGCFEGLLLVQLLALFLQQKDSFSATLQVPPCTRW